MLVVVTIFLFLLNPLSTMSDDILNKIKVVGIIYSNL